MTSKLKLIAILSAAFIIYSFRLTSIPNGIYVDEAAVGVNALSLLNTDRDEYGQFLPLYFRFFNSYTPGLYVYFVLPFIKILGLSAYAIRLPSVVVGVASVYIFYLTPSLFSRKPFWGTLFYTILPWTVFNSRLGYEVMFAVTIFNAGIYLLLKSERPHLFGLMLVSLSTYAAHTQRYQAPIFILLYFIFVSKISRRTLFYLFISQIPNILFALTPVFWIKNQHLSLKYILPQIVSCLSPKTLFFFNPDIDLQHQIPQTSMFFWWMIIPLIIGLKRLTRHRHFMIIWLISAVAPASFSGEFISIQRVLPLLFPLMIIISLGLVSGFFLKSILFFYSLVLLIRSYFFLLPQRLSLAWNYGYDQLSQFIDIHPGQQFLIDNSRNPRNYILPLFYLQIPYHHADSNGIYQYANLTFKPIDWQEIKDFDYIVSDGLAVSPDQAAEHQLKLENTILTPLSQTALQIYSVNSDKISQ